MKNPSLNQTTLLSSENKFFAPWLRPVSVIGVRSKTDKLHLSYIKSSTKGLTIALFCRLYN